MANRKPHILATCRLGHRLTTCAPESIDCDTPYPSTWRLGIFPHGQSQAPYPCHVQAGAWVDNLLTRIYWLRYLISFHVKAGDLFVHLKQLILAKMREIMAEIAAPRLLWLTQTRGCKKWTCRILAAHNHKQWEDKTVSVPEVFSKLLSRVSRWLLQTSGKSKRPNPCYMQAGKFKPQILATCRLGNQNPKSLLCAGWEIKTPNPCYMQVEKSKPQILATCRLENSKPKSLLHAGWKIKNPNPCYMQVGKSKPLILATCRLGNSTLNT